MSFQHHDVAVQITKENGEILVKSVGLWYKRQIPLI